MSTDTTNKTSKLIGQHRLTRRNFLKGAIALGSGAMLYVNGNQYRITLAAGPVVYKLRVLHTNDHHARIEPVSVTIRSTPAPAFVRNFGGVARRKTLIDQLKLGKAADEEILLIDAGDVFQGTLYFNQYNGAADLYFYNQLGYEAMAIGNHEFDKGQDKLKDFVTGTTFPVLSANTEIDVAAVLAAVKSATPLTGAGKIGPRTIITKGAKKIGIFGLTTPDTAVLSSPGTGVTFNSDLTAVAQAQVTALKSEGADYIVALTHIGYDADKVLAAAVKGINLIVGGHSHTPIIHTALPALPVGVATAGSYPTVIKDPDGKDTIVVTDWEWGKWLGDITLGFDADGVVSVITGVIRPVWADNIKTSETPAKDRALLTDEGAEIVADPAFVTKIDTDYKPAITTLRNTQVGSSSVLLDGARANIRSKETNLGNLVCDSVLAKLKPSGAQIAIITGGGIRTSIIAGNVTLGNVIEVLPFANTLYTVQITGQQVIEALENGVSLVETAQGRFPQVAGLRFTWTASKKFVAGKINRILNVEVEVPTPTSNSPSTFVAINPTANYIVGTNNFMATGGDGYATFAAATVRYDTGFLDSDTLAEYITAQSPVSTALQGRITRKYFYNLPWVANQPTTGVENRGN